MKGIKRDEKEMTNITCNKQIDKSSSSKLSDLAKACFLRIS